MEYTIKNAVVLHNDIAELYWCFLENTSSDTILDYKLKVHLPGEDNNVMVWSHGPSTEKSNIIDNKTTDGYRNYNCNKKHDCNLFNYF